MQWDPRAQENACTAVSPSVHVNFGCLGNIQVISLPQRFGRRDSNIPPTSSITPAKSSLTF